MPWAKQLSPFLGSFFFLFQGGMGDPEEPVTDCIHVLIMFLSCCKYSACISSVELKHLVIIFYLTGLVLLFQPLKLTGEHLHSKLIY